MTATAPAACGVLRLLLERTESAGAVAVAAARAARSHGRRPRSHPRAAARRARTRRSPCQAAAGRRRRSRGRSGRSTPAFVAGGPKRAQPAPKSPTPFTTTWFWLPELVAPGQRYICIRGTPVPGVGSVGVEKLALFVADSVLGLAADVVAAETAAAVVVVLEVPRRLVEAVAVEDVVERVAPVEQVRDDGVAVELRVLASDRPGSRNRAPCRRSGCRRSPASRRRPDRGTRGCCSRG